MSTRLDPMTFAVVRNGLISAANEIYWAFKRTAMLPLLYEFNDFGMSLFDAHVNLVADAPGIPLFVGSLDTCVERSLEVIGGTEQLEPGDVLFTNNPYLMGGQTADAALMEPIFHQGELIGFGALRAHMGDFGAINAYPCNSTDLYQEGTLFPPLKLYERDKLNDTIIKIIEANSRLPAETAGSVLAGVGALRAGSRKVLSIVTRYGRETYAAAIEELLNQSERATRQALADVPDGTYVLEDSMDDNGVEREPVKLRCAVTIAGTEMAVDLAGSAPEQSGPLNCPWGYTLTACRFALKRLTTPDLPPSSGGYRPLTVTAPAGSIFDPQPPAPCFISALVALRLSDMILQALAPALPDRVPAENGGDIMNFLAYLRHPVSGRLCFFFDLGGLGHGALRDRDGMSSRLHSIQAGSESMPAEILETRMPVLKRRFELVTDSGGPGKFRGGLSAAAEFQFESEGLAVGIVEKSRASQVRGLGGGMSPPFRNSVVMFPGTEKELRLGKQADIPVARGDVALVKPAGGGGYGNPLERDPERVGQDVRNDYVSLEQSEQTYGVVVTDPEAGGVDLDATQQLRTRLVERSPPSKA